VSGNAVELPRLAAEVAALQRAGRVVVFTNGCFDLLHVGHLRLLRAAAAEGDLLVVGINDDASVRRLKGAGRPFIPVADRAELLAGLEPVDRVIPFGEDTPLRLIETLSPRVLVKGADWALDRMIGKEHVEARGGRVVRVPLEPGRSTTELIERIRSGG
jgi:D-beta-D-heptose 7-phosphate kinase/D-beta-D-heptose 1-phosphate adenosyltransferase